MKGEKQMKNKSYEKPEFEITLLYNLDVLTASNPEDPFRGEDDTLELAP